MVKESIDPKALHMLDKYVTVLADAYPEPVRATELAEKTGLTKPAVTKVRDRLMQLCNPKSMAFDKGFVLLDDVNVFGKLFQIYAANGRHRQFFQSKFVRSFIVNRPIHHKIIQTFPLYGKYFTEDDTKFLTSFCIQVVSGLEPNHLQDLIKSLSRNKSLMSDYRFVATLQTVIKQLQLMIKNEDELRTVLVLRDKFFFLIRDYLWGTTENMKILDKLDANERSKYIEVYKHTLDFYLRQIFEALNEPITAAAKSSKIEVKNINMDVGTTALVAGT